MINNLDSFNTERLAAERLQNEHFDFIHDMHQNNQIMLYLGGVRSHQQTLAYMERNLSHWEKYGYGIWILREKITGYHVGRGGLRNATLEGKIEVEVAYGLLPEFWNKGLATEFTMKIVQIGLFKIGFSSLVSITKPDNLASQAVMRKSGFEFERETIYNKELHLLFRHRNKQFL